MHIVILFVSVVIFLLCMTRTCLADHAPAAQTELVDAFELTFAIPQGYDDAYMHSYEFMNMGDATGTRSNGSGEYYYWIEDNAILNVLLSAYNVSGFEDMVGLHPRMGSQEYLNQVAELVIANALSDMYEWEYIETGACPLLRVRGVEQTTGSSFDVFVAHTSNYLYIGMASVFTPGYVDTCRAYMDVVLSKVLPE